MTFSGYLMLQAVVKMSLLFVLFILVGFFIYVGFKLLKDEK